MGGRMGKALLALGCALLAAMMPAEGARMGDHDMQPVIGLDPIPPHQGDKLTVTYSGRLPVTLELDWHPSGSPTTVTINSAGGTTITVPAGASSLIVHDPTGGADDESTVILP